ncbi:unnamed protein product [Dovyalis caffra]|uniref:Cytochrome P450 n=1 Tax=Dovyalis caffra TaxID=77055 RepID=A0AAV1RSQ1_9ROSI|nr:unnamed protein product [Dovyalis caffra]
MTTFHISLHSTRKFVFALIPVLSNCMICEAALLTYVWANALSSLWIMPSPAGIVAGISARMNETASDETRSVRKVAYCFIAPYCFITFEGGPRMCPGYEFARIEALVTIHNLIARYKWKLCAGSSFSRLPVLMPSQGLPDQVLPKK